MLESADSLSVFGAEDPDWLAARAAERLSARQIANALDLFPSEAEEVAADESGWSSGGGATSPEPPTEFDSDIDDATEAIERVVPGRAALRMPWTPARVAVMVASLAASLGAKKSVPFGLGTLRDDTATFGGLLFGTIVIIGALLFLPAAVLGPVAEHLGPIPFGG